MIYHHSKRFKNWFSHYDKIVMDISGYTARKKNIIRKCFQKTQQKIGFLGKIFEKELF